MLVIPYLTNSTPPTRKLLVVVQLCSWSTKLAADLQLVAQHWNDSTKCDIGCIQDLL
jgi:hypothetical protein